MIAYGLEFAQTVTQAAGNVAGEVYQLGGAALGRDSSDRFGAVTLIPLLTGVGPIAAESGSHKQPVTGLRLGVHTRGLGNFVCRRTKSELRLIWGGP